MSQEYEGKKIEMSVPVIGTDVHEFMEMVAGFLKATGWGMSTIQSGFKQAATDIKEQLDNELQQKEKHDHDN